MILINYSAKILTSNNFEPRQFVFIYMVSLTHHYTADGFRTVPASEGAKVLRSW